MTAEYRRYIKIDGKLVASPAFPSKKEADDWYEARKAERTAVKRGRRAGYIPTFMEFTGQWMRGQIADYEKPTWGSYESNLRLHLLPYLKDYRMDEITRAKCREVLMLVTRNGYSINHRKHVQTTLSKIFVAALNSDPPIVETNPVYRITFDGKRTSKTFKPNVLETKDDVAEFMRVAKDISDMHFVLACVGLMAALRRGEIIALRWSSLRPKSSELRISEVYRDAMRTITRSTKSGEDVSRDVPVPQALIDILKTYRARTGGKDSDFIFVRPDGKNFCSEEMHDLFVEIRTAAERPDLTLHSMRHTYGRLFAAQTGNLKALQAIFGHSSQAMTSKYSELTSAQIKPFAEVMSVNVSDSKDTGDTRTTMRAARK